MSMLMRAFLIILFIHSITSVTVGQNKQTDRQTDRWTGMSRIEMGVKMIGRIYASFQ